MIKKSFGVAFFLMAFVGVFSSCNDEFEIAAPYKRVSVVYGLLNQRDTAHYVRIFKAFLDDKKSALVMAQNPDSSTLNDITVSVKEFNNNTLVTTIPLTKVDLANEGYTKPEGTFYSIPHTAYKFKHALRTGYTYRLVIAHDDGKVDSAETMIIDSNMMVSQLLNPGYQIEFSRTTGNGNFELHGNWPQAAKYLETIMRFNYVDKDVMTNVQTDKHVDFKFTTPVVYDGSSGSFIIKQPRVSFYDFLSSAIPKNPGGLERYLDSCDIFVWSGGEELYNYNRVAEVQSSGLTADQIQIKYTNIKGENVIGIFNTRGLRFRTNIALTGPTVDSIKVHPKTVGLNVIGRSDH